MDAQNAAETDQARSSAASPQRRRGSQVDAKIASALDSKTGSSPSEIKPKFPSTTALLSRPDDGADDRDSDAETIVLPGKDGHSPSKVRKVRQEDKSESDADALKSNSSLKAFKADVDSITARPGDAPKQKRHSSSAGSRLADKASHSRGKDRAGSSGLSSAPTSPTQTQRRLQHRRPRSRSDAAHISESDSDEFANKPPKSSLKDKIKSGDRINSQKRKAPKVESDDEADLRKARRQRTTSVSVDVGRNSRDARVSSRSQREARSQSRSPPPRNHRRSASTQLPSSNGLSHKKKRLPPPLQSTEYHSDDSSTSESPHPRSTKLRSLVTPSNSESHMSPAKVGPHKKHLDAHGQTLLARACARGEYDVVKQRLGERPEDLNVADYAGNTPLQIAAINGCEDIVKLLIQAGCNMDCVNYDKDTPLLDAVDNGHLEVVKLLLDAGVNPRKANVSGQEPIDRVTEETDHADEIRALLIAARKKAGDRMRTSEDRHSHHDFDTRDSHAPESPRRSPAAPSGRRSTTGRATKTRNDLLYMPLDDKTLRQAAGRGDEETVARILQVKEGFDDPESMVAAARGGHDLVIQLLLGLGGANADPGPVASLAAEFATPVLAAIGQENIKVVKLLLEQQGFDPTRRFKGETYYEIARRRQGPNWKEEEDILRAAYDEYKRTHKDGAPNKSPGRKERERDEKRAKRDEARVDAKRERKTGSKLDGQGSKRRSDSFSTHGDEESAKRGPGRPRKEEKLPAMQDVHREASPNLQNKSAKMKRAESDAAAASSDGESVKPRRKLVSKGELRGEREKKGRVSAGKEPTSPKASRNDEAAEKQKLSEKYHDRTKALKHDPSREIDTTSKRHRKSTTPERSADADKNEAEVSVKRRRLEIDAPEKKSKRSALEDKTKKTNGKGASDEDLANDKRLQESRRSDSDRSASSDKVKIKSEDIDIAMTEAPLKESSEEEGVDEAEVTKRKEEEEALKKEKKRLEEEQARRLEEEELKAKEEERQRREAEAARLHEEEEKRKREEEERRQREEEERQHREQLEREAEEAKRQQEEEERKERERRHREEVERKRAAREAEAKRLREEEERVRLDKLPPLLRWLQICPNPKLSSVAEKFRFMSGVRYDTIHPAATGTAEGREQWVLNTHVALLLGEKDLNLSRYTAWDRAPVSHLAKMTLWRTEWELYSLLSEKYWDLGQQVPDYYSGEDPTAVSFQNKQKLKQAAWERFSATEMFFVKLSELLYIVPNIPHLRNVTLAVEYRELLESEAQAVGWKAPLKWKQDPGADRFHGFAPRYKYYLGGYFLREDTPTKHLISSTPFPEKRVPRRGLVQVFPDDPEYEKLCLQQGLEHLVKGQSSPSLPNGVHTSAIETKLLNGTNGHGHGHLEAPSVAVNGGSH